MLKLDQITVQYGALTALNKVGLCIAEGTISVVEGHHGAGKSSLLRAIIGAVPSKGKVWLDQRLITRRSPARLLQWCWCQKGDSYLGVFQRGTTFSLAST
jgi:ABC-type branched-subunit amino acid transport system ATPase component